MFEHKVQNVNFFVLMGVGSTKNAPNYNHFSIQQYLILTKWIIVSTKNLQKQRMQGYKSEQVQVQKISVELFFL